MLLWQVPASSVRIFKNGMMITDAVNLYAVTEPYKIVIGELAETSGIEGFNIVEVDYKRVRMLEANCPDGICTRQGWVSSGLVPIVCLPNRVVVAFEGSSGNEGVDAVVG